MNHAVAREHHRMLDAIFELSDIAWPVVRHQHVDGTGGDAPNGLAHLLGEFPAEVIG